MTGQSELVIMSMMDISTDWGEEGDVVGVCLTREGVLCSLTWQLRRPSNCQDTFFFVDGFSESFCNFQVLHLLEDLKQYQIVTIKNNHHYITQTILNKEKYQCQLCVNIKDKTMKSKSKNLLPGIYTSEMTNVILKTYFMFN